jgi:hypothetical protein
MYMPKAIAALPKWTDDDQSRYQLECVRILREGPTVFAEATDGRRLCRLTWQSDGSDGEYRLEAKRLSKVLKAVGVSDDGYCADQTQADWSSPSCCFTGVRYTGKAPALMLSGRNCCHTVPSSGTERKWPKTEDVLYPPAQAKCADVNVRDLREQARAAIKAQPKVKQLGMDLELAGVKVRLDARYVRDMAETAIQCGYDQVQVSATDKQNAVHFWAYTDVKFESVIMPLAAD